MTTMMKTIVFALLLSISCVVRAENYENFPSEKDKALAESGVQLKMPYPSEAIQLGMEGFVLISVDYNGNQLTILGINGSDEILIQNVKNYVLENTDLFSTTVGERVYRFNFTII